MEPALTVIYKLHLERALISVLLSCNPEVNSWVIENNTWGGDEGYTLQRLCAKKELHARSILHISHFAFFLGGNPFDLSYFVVRKSASRRVFPALKPALKNAQYPLFFLSFFICLCIAAVSPHIFISDPNRGALNRVS